MKLFSAFEDFVRTTLGSVPGELRRLRFLASMRNKDRYEHWGLSRTYGEEAAQRAINDAHAETFERTLTTPLPKVYQDEVSNTGREPDPLGKDTPVQLLLPTDLRGGSPRHLGLIVRIVGLLKRSSAKPGT